VLFRSELYSRTTEQYLSLGILVGCYYDFIPEAMIESWDLQDMTSPKIKIRCLKDFDFDCRRIWRLCTVWFDGKPIMITQNAGREGDDHACRFITDEDGYRNMIQHLVSIKIAKINEITDVISPDEDMKTVLTSFYSNSLDGYFERF